MADLPVYNTYFAKKNCFSAILAIFPFTVNEVIVLIFMEKQLFKQNNTINGVRSRTKGYFMELFGIILGSVMFHNYK